MRQNQITVIVGRKGSGKTTQAMRAIEAATRRVIIDPMFEYQKLGVVVPDFHSLTEYIRPLRHHRYSVVLQTTEEVDVYDTIELATSGTPQAPALPGVTIVLDEADKLCSATQIPEELRRLFNYGRHFSVSAIAVSRRPRAIHRDITANADRIIIGQTQEPRDLDYLEEFIGERLKDRAAKLAVHQFVIWPDDLEPIEHEPPEPPPASETAPGTTNDPPEVPEHAPPETVPPTPSMAPGAESLPGVRVSDPPADV